MANTGRPSSRRNRTAGSGGRVRRGLRGKGPTPKAEDRPNHKAYKAKQGQSAKGGAGRSGPNNRSTAEWVFGRNPVLEALHEGIPVQSAYVAEGTERDDRMRDIFKYCADNSVALLQVTRAELDKLTGGVHQGVALKLPPYQYAEVDELIAAGLEPGSGVVVVCDHITDPRNLGAIIRSAAAFDSVGVVIPTRRAASMTAVTWKTSAGAAARLPVAQANNLNQALQRFAKAGFQIAGLAGDGEVDIDAIPGVDGPLVLVVGSEGDGMARLVREHCDVVASIPIGSATESLNASVAAAIALYEVSRSRPAKD